MKVRLILLSTMKNVLPQEEMDIELKEGATLADLYEELAVIAATQSSSALWNPETKRFRGPVIITCDSQVVKDENTCLYDGQQIEIKRFLIGG